MADDGPNCLHCSIRATIIEHFGQPSGDCLIVAEEVINGLVDCLVDMFMMLEASRREAWALHATARFHVGLQSAQAEQRAAEMPKVLN